MQKKRNGKRASRGGRPAGGRTRYPGIEAFARQYGCSAHFARQVLDGRGVSRPLTEAWGEWQLRAARA